MDHLRLFLNLAPARKALDPVLGGRRVRDGVYGGGCGKRREREGNGETDKTRDWWEMRRGEMEGATGRSRRKESEN